MEDSYIFPMDGSSHTVGEYAYFICHCWCDASESVVVLVFQKTTGQSAVHHKYATLSDSGFQNWFSHKLKNNLVCLSQVFLIYQVIFVFLLLCDRWH